MQNISQMNQLLIIHYIQNKNLKLFSMQKDLISSSTYTQHATIALKKTGFILFLFEKLST